MSDLEAGGETCPYCAETVATTAKKCRHCQGDLTEAASRSSSDGEPGATPISFWASLRLLRIMVVLVVVLAIAAGLAWWRSETPAAGEAPNAAITSIGARDAGLQAATQLTQKVLSFNWRTLDEDVRATQAVLAPTFRGEYTEAMDGVRAQTVKNQVKLTASAVATSIVSASAEKVVALVFVNQVTAAKGIESQRLDQSRVLVTLTHDGEEWRVSKMARVQDGRDLIN